VVTLCWPVHWCWWLWCGHKV